MLLSDKLRLITHRSLQCFLHEYDDEKRTMVDRYFRYVNFLNQTRGSRNTITLCKEGRLNITRYLSGSPMKSSLLALDKSG